MSTLGAIRQAVTFNRLRNERDFELWEAENARRDELTDQSERLAAPMENSFEYTLNNEGKLVSDRGESILQVVEDGYRVAQHQAQFDQRWVFEAERRGIELDEQRQIEDFARTDPTLRVRMTSLSLDRSDYEGMRAIATALGYSMPPDRPQSEDILRSRLWIGTPPGLIVLSPCPDAVREHGVDIGAYDKDRLKMVVRIVTLVDPMLGDHRYDEHKELISRIRDSYDSELSRQFGGDWYAGRNQISAKNALAFIEQQTDLIEAHMAIVNQVRRATQDKEERSRLLAPHRYNFAAALDDRLHGRHVTSLGDSGGAARAEGKTFDGDCPVVEATATAAEQATALGYRVERPKEILKCVNCPYCKKLVDAIKRKTAKERTIECQSCFAKVDLNTGERIDKRALRTVKKMGAAAVRAVAKVAPRRRHGDIIKTKQGNFRYEERVVVGGAKREYVDLKTGTRTSADAPLEE